MTTRDAYREIEGAIARSLYNAFVKTPSHLQLQATRVCMEILEKHLSKASALYTSALTFHAVAECHDRVSKIIASNKQECPEPSKTNL